MPEGSPENVTSVYQYSQAKYDAMKAVVETYGEQLGPVRLAGHLGVQPGQTFESYTKRGEEYTMPRHAAVLKPDHVVVELTTPAEASLTRDRIRRLSAEIVKSQSMPVSYSHSQAPITPTIAPVTPLQLQPLPEAAPAVAQRPEPRPAAPRPPRRPQQQRGLFKSLFNGMVDPAPQNSRDDNWYRGN